MGGTCEQQEPSLTLGTILEGTGRRALGQPHSNATPPPPSFYDGRASKVEAANRSSQSISRGGRPEVLPLLTHSAEVERLLDQNAFTPSTLLEQMCLPVVGQHAGEQGNAAQEEPPGIALQ